MHRYGYQVVMSRATFLPAIHHREYTVSLMFGYILFCSKQNKPSTERWWTENVNCQNVQWPCSSYIHSHV